MMPPGELGHIGRNFWHLIEPNDQYLCIVPARGDAGCLEEAEVAIVGPEAGRVRFGESPTDKEIFGA